MRSPNLRYVPQVDHLRALAVLQLVFYHGLALLIYHLKTGQIGAFNDQWWHTRNPFMTALVEGHSSVAFFMVLSGFIFMHGVGERDIDYRGFFVNRLWRIYPMYVFWLVVTLYAVPGTFNFLGFLQSLVFLGNMPGSVTAASLGVAWAIAVEFQFYLLFPLLVRFMRAHGMRFVLGVMTLTLVVRGIIFLHSNAVREASYQSILGRLDQFLLGMLAARALAKAPLGSRARRWLKASLPLAVAAVLAWLWWFHLDGGWQTDKANRIVWPTIEGLVFAAMVLCYVAFDDGTGVAHRWWSRWAARIGEVSFSVYLVHVTVFNVVMRHKWVFAFSRNVAANALLNTLIVVLPATLLLSTLTYLVIEKPFMGMRSRYLRYSR